MTTKTLTRPEPPASAQIVEQALVTGNLKALTAEQRVLHYLRVCESLGLNPHTQPFDYLEFQGKLRLYPKRDCTDQLRNRDGVSVVGLKTTLSDSILTVTAEVENAQGRRDADVGCVFVGGLKGEAMANAHMKAVTKAKRRATLSLCGLGWMDESEVESVPGAHAAALPAPSQVELFCAQLEAAGNKEQVQAIAREIAAAALPQDERALLRGHLRKALGRFPTDGRQRLNSTPPTGERLEHRIRELAALLKLDDEDLQALATRLDCANPAEPTTAELERVLMALESQAAEEAGT